MRGKRPVLGDRNRFALDEQEKRRQALELSRRFANYDGRSGRGAHRVGETVSRLRGFWWFVFALALACAAGYLWVRSPEIIHRFQVGWLGNATFPATGQTRWFIPVVPNAIETAQLTITGLNRVQDNIVVQLEGWESHVPIAHIPVRGGETAEVQVPLGVYRISYAPNAAWNGQAKLIGETQEAVDPLVFYRSQNAAMGHRIDLNRRINGNMRIRKTSVF